MVRSDFVPNTAGLKSVTSFRNATSDPVIASLSTGSFVDPYAAAATTSAGQANTSLGPAATVALSDQAKAIMAKAASEQKVADRLQSHVDALKQDKGNSSRDNDRKSMRTQESYDRGRSLYDQIYDLGRELMGANGKALGARQQQDSDSATADIRNGVAIWQQAGKADNLAILRAGAQLYNKPEAMIELATKGGQFASSTEGQVISDDTAFVFTMHQQVAQGIADLRAKGMTSQANDLSEAMRAGTLNFQYAEDVPELNMKTDGVRFDDGGGISSTTVNPTGAIKKALDGGTSLAISGGERGNFYVTWPSKLK